MSTYSKRKKRARGSIILLAIFFLIVLFSLAVAFFRIIPAEFHSATQARRTVQAQYAADAGVREAVAWLKMQEAVDAGDLATWSADHDDPEAAGAKLDDEWSYTCELETVDVTRKIYQVTSTAHHRGRPVREVVTTIQNETFAKYALFYDTWGDDFLYTMKANSIQGPFHTNDYFHLAAPSSAFWTDGNQPFVNGSLAEMTYASELPSAQNLAGAGIGDGQMYYGGNFGSLNFDLTPYNATGVPNTDRYNKMISGGRERLSQTPHVDFPEAVTELRTKAWGAANSDPASLAALGVGPLLVNTDDGANVAGGDVVGGIVINEDARTVRLEITSGNGDHQKIRVRDSGDTTIPGPPNTVWRVDVPQYRVRITPPPRTVTVPGGCIASHQETQPVMNWVNHPVTVFGAHPSCGTEVIFIPGDGGVSTPITVNRECDYTQDNWVYEQTGTQEVTVCDEYGPPTTTTVQDPDYWQTVDSTYPGATFWRNQTVSASEGDPGAYPVTNPTSTTIQTWNSVVEVNDADYRIPYYSGVKVNGETITDPADSRLIVSDGHTVTIKNDVTVGSTNYQEYTVLNGRTNGVVFSNGNLRDVQGVVKGAKTTDTEGNLAYRGRTIATDIQADKNLEISGNLLQYYNGSAVDGEGQPLNDGSNRLRRGAQSPNADHILGVIANNIDIRQNDGTNSSNFQNTRDTDGEITSYNGGMTVYGVLMAGRKVDETTVNGGFGAHDRAMQNGDGLGDFNLFGGIISGNARKTQTGYQGNGSHGFRMNLNYDEIAALNLENFPPTNQYSVTRYVTISLGGLDTGFGSMGGN